MNYDLEEFNDLITKMLLCEMVDVEPSMFKNDLSKVYLKDRALTI